jgi:hypothetical protein
VLTNIRKKGEDKNIRGSEKEKRCNRKRPSLNVKAFTKRQEKQKKKKGASTYRPNFLLVKWTLRQQRGQRHSRRFP